MKTSEKLNEIYAQLVRPHEAAEAMQRDEWHHMHAIPLAMKLGYEDLAMMLSARLGGFITYGIYLAERGRGLLHPFQVQKAQLDWIEGLVAEFKKKGD